MFWLKVLDSVATSEICRDIPSKNTLLLLICPHINSMKTMPPRPSSCFLSLLSCSIKIKFKKKHEKAQNICICHHKHSFLAKSIGFCWLEYFPTSCQFFCILLRMQIFWMSAPKKYPRTQSPFVARNLEYIPKSRQKSSLLWRSSFSYADGAIMLISVLI